MQLFFSHKVLILFSLSLGIRIIAFFTVRILLPSSEIPLVDFDAFDNIASMGYGAAPLPSCRQFVLIPFLMWFLSLMGVSLYNSQLWISYVAASLGITVFYCVLEQKKVPHAFEIGLILTAQPYHPMISSPGDAAYLTFFLFWAAYYMFSLKKYSWTIVILCLLSLTHFLGVIIATVMLVHVFRKKWEYLVFITVPVVVLGQFTYFYIVRGDFFLFLHAQQAFYYGSNLATIVYPLAGFAAFTVNSTFSFDLPIVIIILVLGIGVLWIHRKEDFFIAFLALYISLLNINTGLVARYFIPFLGLYIWFVVKYVERVPLWNYKFLKIIIPLLLITGTLLAIRDLYDFALWWSSIK